MPFHFTRPSSPAQEGEDVSGLLHDLDIAPKDRPTLEVILDHNPIFLKGTGVDVEPARLSGHVTLYLTEATSIKEIKLHFRGKARLPVSNGDNFSLNANPTMTYIVCNHQWSFLEGDNKHAHTLKAGRHFFPFQLQIGGSLPSSLYTNALGGANVHYKIRAHAVRSGLNSSIQTSIPVSIIRSFAADALEYTQTLDLENTWPKKIMYSIVLPHKAWAVGDDLSALVTFSPLAKGIHVLNILTNIVETTKVYGRSGAQEHSRIVLSVKHDIIEGKAIHLAEPGFPSPAQTQSLNHASGCFPSMSEATVSEVEEVVENENADIVTSVNFPIPLSIVPSHSLEPIIVSHRVRWNILISNLDGHTSELRCSLPITFLDFRLLDEARLHTAPTRRLLLGDSHVSQAEEQDSNLPSYDAHVHDRVGNMFLPEAATMRVSNPWMISNDSSPPSGFSQSDSAGPPTPLESHILSHLPHAPGSGSSTPLDWLNSELLLSLNSDGSVSPTSPDSAYTSRSASRSGSRQASRRGSRRNSLDRASTSSSLHEHIHVHEPNFASRSLLGMFNVSMKPFTALSHPHWPGSRSSLHNHSRQEPRRATFTMTPSTVVRSTPNTPLAGLQLALAEVPDYDVASRGFIGGMPPLSSMRGLPSYEESESSRADVSRSQSESDLASRAHTSILF